jgi:hypothetical protein
MQAQLQDFAQLLANYKYANVSPNPGDRTYALRE